MKKILVIEDSTDVRENLAEILELSGYEVATAENGKIGTEKAIANPPDLILCDVMMPELDGFGVLHILGKNTKTAHLPFIFLTARSEKDDFRKGMSLGADDYITKPFDDVQLLETIERRLKKAEHTGRPEGISTFGGQVLLNENRAFELLRDLPKDRERRDYKRKNAIFNEGEHPRWLFYIESGEVKLFKTSDDGRDFITKISRAGEFLGYLALLQGGVYTENAAVVEDAALRLIPKEDFFNLVFGQKDVAAQFIRFLSNRVAEQEERLVQLAYNSVRKRVADALLRAHAGGSTEIHWLREDLAAFAGTAKETVIRTLADFKYEKIIDVRDGVIVILNEEKLKSMPN